MVICVFHLPVCCWPICVYYTIKRRKRNSETELHIVDNGRYTMEELKEFNDEEINEHVQYNKIQFDHQTDMQFKAAREYCYCCSPRNNHDDGILQRLKSRKVMLFSCFYNFQTQKETKQIQKCFIFRQ